MIPLGPINFSPADIALILGALLVIGVCAALPVTIPLALVGRLRGVQHPGWNAFWYWLWGTGLSVAVMGSLIQTGIGWAVVPLGWIPTGLIAVLAYLRRPRPQARPNGELGWGDMTTGQGER
ncbi:hypothetical protein AB0L70_14750 [Kribbella sp. NPDC051952]|uniref:hypothetical protein n=1 Tax=Kribbella sp. NPDC051952 TaxID=3154851 RepID=UPI003445B91F